MSRTRAPVYYLSVAPERRQVVGPLNWPLIWVLVGLVAFWGYVGYRIWEALS